MAKFHHGINGPFSGKLGTVVGATWKGIPYMRSLPIRTAKATAGEKANRARFTIAQQWLSPLLDFVRVGFKGYTPTVEGFIAAKSYLMKNAMEGTGAESHVNPILMKVSFGDLSLSDNIALQLSADKKSLQFNWDTAIVKEGSHKDQVMMLAYNIEKRFAYFNTFGALRYTGTDSLKLINAKKDSTWHIYVAFVAADRSRQSDSVYLGEITF